MSNSKSIDLLKTGEETLAEIINMANGTSYQASDLVIGAPVVSPDPVYNTDIEVTFPLPEADAEGKSTVTGVMHYMRLDLGRLLQGRDLAFRDDNYSTVADLLAPLSEEVRIHFESTDLVQGAIEGSAYPKTVIIKAEKNSLRFFGQFSVSVLEPIEDDSSIVTDVEASVNATQQMTASNGEVRVTASAQYIAEPKYVANKNGVYTLRLIGDADWQYVYGFELIDQKNADRITDLYDCTLKVTCVQTNAYLSFKLVRLYGKLQFVDTTNNLKIEDPELANPEQTSYHDERSLRYYKGKLGSSMTQTADGVPVGTFNFELTATRKSGSADPVTVAFTAEVIDLDAIDAAQ